MAARIEEKVASPPFIARLESLEQLVNRLLRYRILPVSRIGHGKRSLEFLGYRPYLPGDELQRLDLNVYRRLNELMVKEHVREAPVHWMIAFDCSASMALYGKFSFAREMAAAFLYLGSSIAERVTLYTFPDQKKFTCYQRKSGVRRVLEALDALKAGCARQEPDIYPGISQLPSCATVIFISDFYGKFYRHLFSPLRLKHIRGIALHIISEEDKKPNFHGDVVLQDAESGVIRKSYVSALAIARYKKRFHRHVTEVKYFCRQNQVFYKEVAPEISLQKSTLEILKLAGLLR